MTYCIECTSAILCTRCSIGLLQFTPTYTGCQIADCQGTDTFITADGLGCTDNCESTGDKLDYLHKQCVVSC